MSYNLLPTTSLWQLKLCRKFDSKLTSTGRVICHLCRDPVSFSHWGNSDPVNLRAILANCFHKFCGEPSKKKRTKLWGHCVITLPYREHRAYHCVTRSHNPAEVGGTRGSHANAGEEEQGVDRALSATSLTKWHHRSELRLHSCLVAGDNGAHAWTRRSSKRMRRTSLPPLVSRKTMVPPPSPFTLCTPGMSRAGETAKKEGSKKKKKIHLVSFVSHKTLNRRWPSTT